MTWTIEGESIIGSNQLSVLDALSAGPVPTIRNVKTTQDNGVWLIVIVFGYIFGLFLIFVIIWFIWYGTSLRRKTNRLNNQAYFQNSLHQRNNNIHRHHPNHNNNNQQMPHLDNGHISSSYEYSRQSSLNRIDMTKVAQNHNHSHCRDSVLDSPSYSPHTLTRNNITFLQNDELIEIQHCNGKCLQQQQQQQLNHYHPHLNRIINPAVLLKPNDNNMKYTATIVNNINNDDDNESSSSFIQSYHQRV
jgi:hypothetical protein